jgi:hypothetical protein
MVKKRSHLYSNGQIHIQTIKFKFKRTNQELTVHYRPPAPVAGGSAGGRYPYHPVPLPRLPGRAGATVPLEPALLGCQAGWLLGHAWAGYMCTDE